jgi:hypothetical protein
MDEERTLKFPKLLIMGMWRISVAARQVGVGTKIVLRVVIRYPNTGRLHFCFVPNLSQNRTQYTNMVFDIMASDQSTTNPCYQHNPRMYAPYFCLVSLFVGLLSKRIELF